MAEKFSFKLFADVGTSELFIARLNRFWDLLGGFPVENNDEIKKLLTQATLEDLLSAFMSLRDLRKEWLDQKVPERKKQRDIENIYRSVIVAYKDKLQTIAKIIGYDIGFLFQQNQNVFEKKFQDFLTAHPEMDPEFVDMIVFDRRNWLAHTIAVRNDAIDHPSTTNPELLEKLKASMTLESVEMVFGSCWRSMEDVLFFLIRARLKHERDQGRTYGGLGLYISPVFVQDESSENKFSWWFDDLSSNLWTNT